MFLLRYGKTSSRKLVLAKVIFERTILPYSNVEEIFLNGGCGMTEFHVVPLPRGQWLTMEQVPGKTLAQERLHKILTSYEVLPKEGADSVVYEDLKNNPEHISALTKMLTKIIDKWTSRDERALLVTLKKAYLKFMVEWLDVTN